MQLKRKTVDIPPDVEEAVKIIAFKNKRSVKSQLELYIEFGVRSEIKGKQLEIR